MYDKLKVARMTKASSIRQKQRDIRRAVAWRRAAGKNYVVLRENTTKSDYAQSYKSQSNGLHTSMYLDVHNFNQFISFITLTH